MQRGNTDTDTYVVRDDREAVSVIEAARLLSVGRSTVYELIRAGRLKSIKLGKRRLVLRRSCAELLRRAS